MLQPKRNEKSPQGVEGGHKEPEPGEEHTAWKDDLPGRGVLSSVGERMILQ